MLKKDDIINPKDVLSFVKRQKLRLPLFASKVSAGFPSPADDYIESQLDLNEHLVKHPSATFFVRATGTSMLDAGIHPDDIVIVDRSLEPVHNNIIVAALNGELTIKRLHLTKNSCILMPENAAYSQIHIQNGDDFTVWGVCTNVIHSLKK